MFTEIPNCSRIGDLVKWLASFPEPFDEEIERSLYWFGRYCGLIDARLSDRELSDALIEKGYRHGSLIRQRIKSELLYGPDRERPASGFWSLSSAKKLVDEVFESAAEPLTDLEIKEVFGRLQPDSDRESKLRERQEALQGALDGLDEELAQREAEDASRASQRAVRLRELFAPAPTPRLRRGSPLDD